MPNSPSIEMEELAFHYGRHGFRLHVPSLRIDGGEKVAFIGASGSGKTTLMHLMAGIVRPSAGRLRVGGASLEKLGEQALRKFRIARVGLVFQEFELVEYLSVRDNILLSYYLHDDLHLTAEVRARADDLAASVGLGHALKRRPHALSQGERQRVALARALLTDPEFLFADEPTGNLDPATTKTIIDLLFEKVSQRQATLVMVTHDHSLLQRFDRVVDMARLEADSSTPAAESEVRS